MAQDVVFNTGQTTPSPRGLPPVQPNPVNTPVSKPPQQPIFSSSASSQMPTTNAPMATPKIPITPSPASPPPPRRGLVLFQLPLWLRLFIGLVIFLVILIAVGAIFKSNNLFQPAVTLQYWGLWENENTMNQILADFTRKYPNIKVVYKEQDPSQYTDRLLTRVKNGNGPDIFTYHNSWLPEMRSILAPLSTDAITTNEFTNAYYPVMQKDLTGNGAIYGIPLEIDTLSLFVNNAILKAAGSQVPTTWDEFSNVAYATTVKDQDQKIKTAGAAIGGYDNVVHASDILAMLIAQNGGSLTDISSKSKNASDALNFYSSFITNENGVWDTTGPSSLVVFGQGNLAMYFGYSYDIFNIRAINPNLDFSVYPVPHLPDRPATIASYWVQGVSIKSQHQKEAMLLMHYLAQKDTLEKLYAIEAKTRAFGEPYPRVDMADLLKDNPQLYPFVEQAKDAVSTYFASNTYDTGINAQMNGYIGNAIRSAISGTSADSAVGTLAQGVTQILQQYGVQP